MYMNKNEDITNQNVWGITNKVLRWNYAAYIKKINISNQQLDFII